jgi:predicted P-loop ATPase
MSSNIHKGDDMLADLTLDDLAGDPYWLAWQTEARTNTKGEAKPTKVPYSPKGGMGASDDEETWGTRARAQRRADQLEKPYKLGGVAVVFTYIDGTPKKGVSLGGIDLDTCVDADGNIADWAQPVIDRFASYTEVSPSGTGFKIFFRYTTQWLPEIRQLMGPPEDRYGKVFKRHSGTDHPPAIELYLGKRYFAVTDNNVPNGTRNLRLVDQADLHWLLTAAGPKFVGNGHDQSASKQKSRRSYSGDSSRSAGQGGACTIALRIRREGGDFDKMCEALRDDDKTASWYREKGDERALKRVWDFAGRKIDAEPKWEKVKGAIVSNNQNNIRLALDTLNVKLSYDSFADRLLIVGPNELPLRHLGDAEVEAVYLEIDEEFLFRPSEEFFRLVVRNEARRNSFHPVRQYLDNLVWDGKPRIDRWLINYAGAKDSDYVRAVSRLVLVAAARRVQEPGCKFDEMLVLINPEQGHNRSTALAVLAVRDDWFSDDLPLGADPKKVIEQTVGKWIIEASELKGIRERTVEHLKSFLSRQIDRARMAYGHLPTDRRRHFVIIGTTNEVKFLRDNTGNRRFWPVAVGRFNLKALRRDRDQLWAEAAAAEAAGESIRLAPELWDDAAKAQKARHIEDPWVNVIDQYLGEFKGKIRANQTWDIVGVPTDRRTQEHNVRLGNAMRANGWYRAQRRFEGKRETAYVRGTELQQEKKTIVAYRSTQGDLMVRYWDESDERSS